MAEQLQDDIAVLILDEYVRFNDYVRSAILPKANKGCGKHLDVSGWGRANFGGKSKKLLSVKQRCLSPKMCKDGVMFNEKSEICAGDLDGSENGPCGGDSGGKCLQ